MKICRILYFRKLHKISISQNGRTHSSPFKFNPITHCSVLSGATRKIFTISYNEAIHKVEINNRKPVVGAK